MNERRHPCTFCDKKFKESTHLTKHLRVHTGERPFYCDLCEKGFQTNSDLKRHKKTRAHLENTFSVFKTGKVEATDNDIEEEEVENAENEDIEIKENCEDSNDVETLYETSKAETSPNQKQKWTNKIVSNISSQHHNIQTTVVTPSILKKKVPETFQVQSPKNFVTLKCHDRNIKIQSKDFQSVSIAGKVRAFNITQKIATTIDNKIVPKITVVLQKKSAPKPEFGINAMPDLTNNPVPISDFKKDSKTEVVCSFELPEAEEKFTCNYCDKDFSSTDTLNDHVQKTHIKPMSDEDDNETEKNREIIPEDAIKTENDPLAHNSIKIELDEDIDNDEPVKKKVKYSPKKVTPKPKDQELEEEFEVEEIVDYKWDEEDVSCFLISLLFTVKYVKMA